MSLTAWYRIEEGFCVSGEAFECVAVLGPAAQESRRLSICQWRRAEEGGSGPHDLQTTAARVFLSCLLERRQVKFKELNPICLTWTCHFIVVLEFLPWILDIRWKPFSLKLKTKIIFRRGIMKVLACINIFWYYPTRIGIWCIKSLYWIWFLALFMLGIIKFVNCMCLDIFYKQSLRYPMSVSRLCLLWSLMLRGGCALGGQPRSEALALTVGCLWKSLEEWISDEWNKYLTSVFEVRVPPFQIVML